MLSQLALMDAAGLSVDFPLRGYHAMDSFRDIVQENHLALTQSPDGEYYVLNRRSGMLVKPRVNGVVYIAGPMRGYEKYNFPAFDKARDELIAAGFYVFNPADLDRLVGVNEDTDPASLPSDFMRDAMDRDLNAITKCTHISLLDGWEASRGVRPEAVLGHELGLQFIVGSNPAAVVPSLDVMAVVGARLCAMYAASGTCSTGQCKPRIPAPAVAYAGAAPKA